MNSEGIKKTFGIQKKETVFRKLDRLRRFFIAANLPMESDGDLVRKVYSSTPRR
jgi:hypothetical protein